MSCLNQRVLDKSQSRFCNFRDTEICLSRDLPMFAQYLMKLCDLPLVMAGDHQLRFIEGFHALTLPPELHFHLVLEGCLRPFWLEGEFEETVFPIEKLKRDDVVSRAAFADLYDVHVATGD